MEIANWITAISTLVMAIATITMAIFAGIALNSWKEEIKSNKILELYNDLYLLFFNLENFLDNLGIFYAKEGEQKCNEKITSFSSEIALFKSKIKIINDNELYNDLDFCFKNIQKTFAWGDSKLLADGNIRTTYQYQTFIDKYLNEHNFSTNIKTKITKIRKTCEDKQQNFYK